MRGKNDRVVKYRRFILDFVPWVVEQLLSDTVTQRQVSHWFDQWNRKVWQLDSVARTLREPLNGVVRYPPWYHTDAMTRKYDD